MKSLFVSLILAFALLAEPMEAKPWITGIVLPVFVFLFVLLILRALYTSDPVILKPASSSELPVVGKKRYFSDLLSFSMRRVVSL